MSKISRRSFFEISTIGGVALTMPLKASALSPLKEKEKLDKYISTTYSFSHDELVKIVNKYGAPTYVYDWNKIKSNFQEFEKAFKSNYKNVKIHYAYKANTNLNIVKYLSELGANAECISEGEMKIALMCDQSPSDIILTSSSKTKSELEFAVEKGVTINIDSISDLNNLIKVIDEKGKKVNITFRINPDVETKSTHKHISTGHKFTKFGLMYHNGDIYKAVKIALEHPKINFLGLHSHIGSQILEIDPFIKNVQIVSEVSLEIKKRFKYEVKVINLGGGLGIPYRDKENGLSPELLAKEIIKKVNFQFRTFKKKPAIWLEPGRYFVAQSGILLSRVNSVKKTEIKNFINVNTGFNHLARPIMYDAYHRVRVLGKNGKIEKYQVAGNICETGDVLTQDRLLPTPEVGDTIAILDAGAYGFSMASEYNSFYLPAEIAYRNRSTFIIRERENFKDIIRNQKLVSSLSN